MFKWWRERKAKKAAAKAAADQRVMQAHLDARQRRLQEMTGSAPRSLYVPYRVITKDSHHCAQTMNRRPDEPVATVPYEGTWSGFDCMSSPSTDPTPSVDTSTSYTPDVGGGGDFGGGGASSDF